MDIVIYDAEDNSEVTSKEFNIQKTIEYFYYLSEETGSFLTMKMNNGQIVQFAWEDNNKWLIDIPLKTTLGSRQTSLQKYADYDECVNIINSTYNNKTIYHLFKVPIMKNTLDNMIVELHTITMYKFNLIEAENIEEEFTYDGWERGLYIYWSAKNGLVVPKIEKIIKPHIERLKHPNHKVFFDILKDVMKTKFEFNCFQKETRKLIKDYLFDCTEDECFYIDLQKLYPNIKSSSEIKENIQEYQKILKLFDQRVLRYI